MANPNIKPAVHNNYLLKNVAVDLRGTEASTTAELSLQELEAMRTQAAPVTASKHGLETICGASCETGAQ